MLRWLGYLWTWPLTLTFDLENSRSNCIWGMGGSIVMERKGQVLLRCPDVKHNHYVTPRQRILLPTGWLKMWAFPSTLLVKVSCFDDYELCIHSSCHNLGFVQQKKTKFTMEQPDMLPILYSKLCAYWCSGDTRIRASACMVLTLKARILSAQCQKSFKKIQVSLHVIRPGNHHLVA